MGNNSLVKNLSQDDFSHSRDFPGQIVQSAASASSLPAIEGQELNPGNIHIERVNHGGSNSLIRGDESTVSEDGESKKDLSAARDRLSKPENTDEDRANSIHC